MTVALGSEGNEKRADMFHCSCRNLPGLFTFRLHGHAR